MTKWLLAETAQSPQGNVGKAKILIADDERDLVKMLSYNLEKKNYQVLRAYDGFEAWKKIESENPDLVILDLMMPELDGWELCRLIRGSRRAEIRDLGILMLTARAQPEDRTRGLELGPMIISSNPFLSQSYFLELKRSFKKER